MIIYELPSNTKIKVKFREPTVDDCMAFCDLNESLEERSTTEYLNMLQEGKVNDSSFWTGDDRRTALWFIYIHSNPELELTYRYDCEHCSNEHYFNVNMLALDANATVLQRKPFEHIKFDLHGQQTTATVKPLDGRALEYIEGARLEAEQLDFESSEFLKAVAYIRMLEVVLCITLPNEPKDWEEAVKGRMAIIRKMPRDSEFKPLVAKVKIALQEMQHGLLSETKEGIVSLISPPHYCPTWMEQKEKGEAVGEAPFTTLLMRFLNFAFIPNALEE